MDIEAELHNSGLTKTEVRVYMYLLEQGISAPPHIARGSRIQRANTYGVLRSLKDKGLIETQSRGKRMLYSAKDPSSIAQRLEAQQESINRLLPDLRALFKSQKNKPSIKFYYGLEEVRELFGRVDGADELRLITASHKIYDEYPDFFKKFRKGLVADGVFVRNILTQRAGEVIAQQGREQIKGYYDVRFFPRKYEDMPTSIRMWGDHVGLVTFDEPAMGTVITSKSLAQTFKTMFEFMWSTGERLS